MLNSAEKVRLAGNQNIMVCERGTMFGYSKSSLIPVEYPEVSFFMFVTTL